VRPTSGCGRTWPGWPRRAVLASLLTLTARQSGNGALAQFALDRALAGGLGYPMDTVLRRIIDSASPPSAVILAEGEAIEDALEAENDRLP
jgi:hypothetical protein